MSPTNVALWNKLNIGIERSDASPKKNRRRNYAENQCFFTHSSDNTLKIFMFADVPHLLKSIRNNFFDYGFIVDGEKIDKCLLEELLQLNCNELKIAINLTRTHLDVKGFQRQRVKLAAQVFSFRNAKALEYCGKRGFLSKENWQTTVNVFKLINNWFNVHNSQYKFGKHAGLHAYGVDLDKQNKTLDLMTELITKMRVISKTHMMPFQKGILLSNKSLKHLLPYLQEKYTSAHFQPQYIITRKLCQDVLENFFSYIRGMGATNDHPSPVDFRNRLKRYILGKHSEHAISVRSNVECDNDSLDPTMNMQQNRSATYYEHDILDDLEDEDLAMEAALFAENSSTEKNVYNIEISEEEEDEESHYDGI